MALKKFIRHLVGYGVGISIFLVLIPYGLWRLSGLEATVFSMPLLPWEGLRFALSAALFMIGMVFVVWSNLHLLFKGKGGPTEIGTLRLSPPTQVLVVSGPYRHTRNPMVFGVHAVYVAWVLYLNSLASLVVLILFFLLIAKKVLAVEERRLLKDFGDAYTTYRAKTPMVVPLLGKQQRNAANGAK